MEEDEELEYDVEQAARVVAERTGIEPEDVEEILEAEFLFQAALGAYEIPDDEEGREFMEEVRRIREAHADLIPAVDADLDEFDDLEDRAVTFIARITAAEPNTIEDVLDEHALYLEELGIIEPEEED
ncbi:MAG: hypothetical protein HY900_04580 [Deltaproteobacteria bacterium]|nr:hypothetical protein [Deltaproteobacteria bacterium]